MSNSSNPTFFGLPRRYLHLWLAAPLGLLGIVATLFALGLPTFYESLVSSHEELAQVFQRENVAPRFNVLGVFTGFSAVILLLASITGILFRRPFVLSLLLRKAYTLVYAWLFVYAYVVFTTSGLLYSEELTYQGVEQTRVTVFMLRWSFLWPALLLTTFTGILHIHAWRRSTMAHFQATPTAPGPAVGDRLLEDIRTHGRDPEFRKNLLNSGGLHLFVIVLLPLLLQMVGCVESYRVPEGSGDPVVALVQVVQPERVEKERIVLNPESAIYLHIPDLDDSEVMEEVEQMSQVTYEADAAATTGRIGRGGGDEGGWPDGMEDGLVRFIRLEYNGAGWDNSMGPGEEADVNFLREFHRITGFPVRERAESHAIRLLARYDEGFAPPFVFITGHGGISIPQRDIAILRDYLEDGGMLFASAGSPQWDRNFRSLMRAVFPGEPLRTIAHDDPIYQMPYTFPHGAPPLWHHGGNQSMGIRREGRWVVFYHPGDIQDAWRTGYSGLHSDLARRAFEMGVNVIYYAFTNYLEQTREHRR